MDLGQNIYLARKRKGMSQEELANRLEVSRQCVSLWETNQTIPNIVKLESISSVLDVPLEYLTGRITLEEEEKNFVKKSNRIKKVEKAGFILSIINIFLYYVVVGIITCPVSFALCLFAYRRNEKVLSVYGIILSVVFYVASILRLILL